MASSEIVPCRLIIESGEHEGVIFPIRDNVVSIGRGPDNSIQIIDSRMSRNHALIILNEGEWFVRDLASKNGVQHNGKLLNGESRLHQGDRIQIGETVFLFEQDGDTATSSSTSSGLRVLDDEGFVTPSHIMSIEDRAAKSETALQGMAAVPTDDGERLDLLYRLADIISSILDQDELFDRIVDLIQRFLKPDRAAILLYDEHYDILLPKVIRRPQDSTDDIIISNSIISQSVNERVAILVSDAPRDVRFKASDSIMIQRIHSAICAPLCYKDEVLGVVYLDRRYPAENFKEDDLKLVAGIAMQASQAIANARLHQRLLAQHVQERELQIARSIQENLLPRAMPKPPGFELAGLCQPARQVGGDYYDVVPLFDGRLILAIADVSGKGVPAAILLSAVRAAAQVEMRHVKDNNLTLVMSRLNGMVCRDTSDSMFVTMILAVLDPAQRKLTYCNAGHVHPVLRQPDGSVDRLDVGGCFLGILPGTHYEQATVDLQADSITVFYSDGVTDSVNGSGDMYGLDRMVDFVNANGGLPAQALLDQVDKNITQFRDGAEPFDDMTLLVLKSVK